MNLDSSYVQQDLDEDALRLGTRRDHRAERQAHALGTLLGLEHACMDEARWSRWMQAFGGLGPLERLIMWSAAVGTPPPGALRDIFRPWEDEERARCRQQYRDFMARARAMDRLVPLLQACFNMRSLRTPAWSSEEDT